MLVLWQWHSKTAYGEDAIIKRARHFAQAELAYYLRRAAEGLPTIDTIDDAIRYLQDSENGVVKDEIQPNEIECEE